MKHFFIPVLCLLGLSATAQTKKIAFKSHGGNAAEFRIALENELFDMDNADFGLPPSREVTKYSLDSVIYVSDSMSVLVVSNFAVKMLEPKEKPRKMGSSKDTVYNHPLFSRQHSLDSIRKALEVNTAYINPPRKIVFVGFDNKKPKEKKTNQLIPVSSPGNTGNNDRPNSPFDGQAFLMLGLVFSVSLLAGYIAWKYKLPAKNSTLLTGN